ncbi:MAG: Transcriptional regulator, GntR family domain / Aspartate aminotransferase [uncultured Pyrinomonadaceae bacterium]|uniref:Transcriptional regulator, GntR family domain / Aspartate aminotransferase n=1 Tax=uncultured Pyrinomonadaceae bacterium TaxID=2283094 RepID=A0A6J4NHU7_9BACT|nr:MAG: Transcriptional regulator, GntR family domain / Aspartate aminotransferase [uncultured Pyrinomonadaceae bacterium]
MSSDRKLSSPPFITVSLESSDVPIYRQVYETLRRAILSGGLAAGAQLPSTRSLAIQLAISRMTVVNAYEQLFAEGYIEGVSGSGTYVASVLPEEFLEIKDRKRRGGRFEGKTQTTLSRRGRLLASFDHAYLRARTDARFSAFHYGLPAMEAFPFDVWSRLASRRLQKMSVSLFGSGNPLGYDPLRRAVAAYLQTSRAVRCSPEQVIICAGAQQALSLAAQILIDEKTIVWTEDPCYLGSRNAFAAAGARIVPIPVDREGFDLGFALKKNKTARLVCVTPSHQFPLGIVMSLARRLALIEWARANEAWIVEDDYDSEFRYAGRPLASLQGLDNSGRVIYVGTFSKTIFPALRLGYMVVPENLIDVFAAARALSDSHSPSIDQAILTDFIEAGHFSRHIRRMRALYAERQAALVAAANQDLAGLLDVPSDEAGMHLIGWLPENVCDRTASEKAREYGIETRPLSAYCSKPQPQGGLILGYTAFSPGQIRNGVERLSRALI